MKMKQPVNDSSEVDHIRLQPENDALAPILLDNVTILGKVVGLYRNHI